MQLIGWVSVTLSFNVTPALITMAFVALGVPATRHQSSLESACRLVKVISVRDACGVVGWALGVVVSAATTSGVPYVQTRSALAAVILASDEDDRDT